MMRFVIEINSLFNSENYIIHALSFNDAIKKFNNKNNVNFQFVDIGVYETNNKRASVFYFADYYER